MRCFVAVETTPEVRRELGQLQRELAAEASGVRWVRPEQMHLTLVFLGEVADGFADAVRQPLAVACSSHRVFEAQPGGIGAFPVPRRARVIWVGLKRGGDELVRLQHSVAAALGPLGFRPEERPFSPHLTLGRFRVPVDLSGATAREFTASTFPVRRIVLIRSELRPDGPRYTGMADVPLAASA